MKPIGRQPHHPRRSRRVIPTRGKRYAPAGAPKGFPLALWKPSNTEAGWKPIGRQIPIPAACSDFPRSKPSARPALICAPLVVCLNCRALTAFGGCTHCVPVFLPSFCLPKQTNALWAASLASVRSHPQQRNSLTTELPFCSAGRRIGVRLCSILPLFSYNVTPVLKIAMS